MHFRSGGHCEHGSAVLPADGGLGRRQPPGDSLCDQCMQCSRGNRGEQCQQGGRGATPTAGPLPAATAAEVVVVVPLLPKVPYLRFATTHFFGSAGSSLLRLCIGWSVHFLRAAVHDVN